MTSVAPSILCPYLERHIHGKSQLALLWLHFSPRGTEFARLKTEPTAPSFRHILDAQVSRISCPNRPESTFRVYVGVFTRVRPFRCKHATVSVPLDPRAAFRGEWVDGA